MTKTFVTIFIAATVASTTIAAAQGDASMEETLIKKMSGITIDDKMRSANTFSADELAGAKAATMPKPKLAQLKPRKKGTVVLSGELEIKSSAKGGSLE